MLSTLCQTHRCVRNYCISERVLLILGCFFSLISRPLPDFILQLWRKISRRLGSLLRHVAIIMKLTPPFLVRDVYDPRPFTDFSP